MSQNLVLLAADLWTEYCSLLLNTSVPAA